MPVPGYRRHPRYEVNADAWTCLFNRAEAKFFRIYHELLGHWPNVCAVTELGAAVWQALPPALQTELRRRPGQPLSDDLLRRCGEVIDERDLPVFWRPDPASDYTQHVLHPDLVQYIARL